MLSQTCSLVNNWWSVNIVSTLFHAQWAPICVSQLCLALASITKTLMLQDQMPTQRILYFSTSLTSCMRSHECEAICWRNFKLCSNNCGFFHILLNSDTSSQRFFVKFIIFLSTKRIESGNNCDDKTCEQKTDTIYFPSWLIRLRFANYSIIRVDIRILWI